MSDPLEAYRSRLLDGPCGQLALGGIVWGDRPAGSGYPAIVLQVISPGRRYDHDGFDGLEAPRVQADIWAEAYADTRSIGDAYILEIERSAIRGGFRFGPGFLDGDEGMAAVTIAGRTGSIYRRSIDMLLTWEAL